MRGRDYEWPGGLVRGLGTHVSTFTGVGGGDVTLHMGPDHPSHVLLPIIPAA